MPIQSTKHDALRGIDRFYVRAFGPDKAQALGLDVPALVLRVSSLVGDAGIATIGHDDTKLGSGQLVLTFRVETALGLATCSLEVFDLVQSLRNSDLQLLASVWFGDTTTFLVGEGTEMSGVMDECLPTMVEEFVADYRLAHP